ncbi:unnamed protein product [Owenia fusiformis]|uniref:SGNH hydrolase-type esterase domain-containing protein n=1 Tax=Owenia fusiformis TaxID=6347 RepID=A0A8S4PA91_OWEFU|nr:unnamed protein product [Owenia fusiformis]
MKKLKGKPEILHDNYHFSDIDDTGILELTDECKSVEFFTERILTWIDAFEAFYRNKSMKAISTRVQHGHVINISDHVIININDSGVISIHGEGLEDWKANDFPLVKDTIVHIDRCPSLTSTPLSGAAVPSQANTSDFTDMATTHSEATDPDGRVITFLHPEMLTKGSDPSTDIAEDSLIFFQTTSNDGSHSPEGPSPPPDDIPSSGIPPSQDPSLPKGSPQGSTANEADDQKANINTQEPSLDTILDNVFSDVTELSQHAKLDTAIMEENEQLKCENNKLRNKITQLMNKNEKYLNDRKLINEQSAKINDLLKRIQVNDQQRADELKAQQILQNAKLEDLESEICNLKGKIRRSEKEYKGLKADLDTTYRRNQQLASMLGSEHNISQPQSLVESPNSSKPDSYKPTPVPRRKLHTKTQPPQSAKSMPAPQSMPASVSHDMSTPRSSSMPHDMPESLKSKTTVHIMYSSNGRGLAGIMMRKASHMNVTSSVYSGGRIEHGTQSIMRGDIKQSTDYKIIGLGTNNIKIDSPDDIICSLKHLAQTARTHHPSSKLIMAGLHHRQDSDSSEDIYNMNSDIDHINSQMKIFCRNEGIGFIDINQVNNSTAGRPNFDVLNRDGLHFNIKGRNSLVMAMLKCINSDTPKTYASIVSSRHPTYQPTQYKL